jgi:hypothetical protein
LLQRSVIRLIAQIWPENGEAPRNRIRRQSKPTYSMTRSRNSRRRMRLSARSRPRCKR